MIPWSLRLRAPWPLRPPGRRTGPAYGRFPDARLTDSPPAPEWRPNDPPPARPRHRPRATHRGRSCGPSAFPVAPGSARARAPRPAPRRPPAAGDPLAALQPPDGEGVPRLGAALRRLPRQPRRSRPWAQSRWRATSRASRRRGTSPRPPRTRPSARFSSCTARS